MKIETANFGCLLCKVTLFTLSFMALASSLGFLLFGWFQNPPAVSHVGNATIYYNYSWVGETDARVGLTLILAAILVWIPKVPRILKAIPLAIIIVQYVLWIATSYQLYALSEDTTTYRGLFLLYDATWWDIIVLMVVLASIICLFVRPQRPREANKHD